MEHLQPSMNLRINLPVLQALFPEDTPARLELTHAIIGQASRMVVNKALSDETREHLNALAKEVTDAFDDQALVKMHFADKPGWNAGKTVVPDSGLGKAIAEYIKDGFDKRFYDLAEKSATERAEQYLAKIEKQVEYEVDKQVKHITAKMVEDRVREALAAAGVVINK